MRYLVPFIVGIALLALWEIWVSLADVPVFILPAPSAIGGALVDNFGSLMAALWVTVKVTALAFFWAIIGAISLAIIFTRARLIEMALYPYVVTLQVTPVVAIAPLILIWVGFDNVSRALVIIAWIVAFFPLLTNTVQGLRSIDPQLHDLMSLSGAAWWQRLIYLELPAALPAMSGVDSSPPPRDSTSAMVEPAR